MLLRFSYILKRIKKFKTRNKGEMLLEQVQRFTLAEKKRQFGFRCTLRPLTNNEADRQVQPIDVLSVG